MEVLPGDTVTIRFDVVASPTATYVWKTTPATTDDPETYTFTVSDKIALVPTSTSVACTCATGVHNMIMFQRNTVSCTVLMVFVNIFICICFAVIVTVDNSSDIVEGHETRITCSIVRSSPSSVAVPVVIWNNITNGVIDLIADYKVGGGLVQPSYSDRFSVKGETTLVIANTLRSDSGTYQCIVNISDDPPIIAFADVTLTVIYAPQISSSIMEVQPGDTVTIRFDVVANPTASYVWKTTPETTDTDTDVETYTFTVSDNIGETYTVTLNVSNEVGESQSTVKVKVVALTPTSTSVAFTCPTVSQKCSSPDTSLTVGMTLLSFFVGIILSSSSFLIHGKIRNAKAKVYMSYRGDPCEENKTYEDLQWIGDNSFM
ncbi:uncharacterized protein LOC117103652 isoform X2 [Anneissia japonica]|uniref:uncharacterized protein LOC117103652 isoform X2 n=1 Tax=Anneissia japonica TaxID=1529436 RepID=UPI001425518E|nr:uncharacterized protein LOC117103652 isoform X2 [Anneissia japonica]